MSNKKNLLNEATIRRFMSLANMQPLSENFLDNVDESDDETVEEGTESEETVEEGADTEETVEEGTESEETVEEEIDLTLEEEEEELPMDMGPEEPGLEGDEAPMDAMDDMPAEEGTEVTLDGDQVATVQAALEDALALVGELGGEGAPPEEPMDAPMDEPMDDMAPEADADEEEDLALEFLDDDAVIQEVFKRVVSRIAKKD